MSNEIEKMNGLVFDKVYKRNIPSKRLYEDGQDELVFENNEYIFTFTHDQDCCESVYIESITGHLDDLTGDPIIAEESICFNGLDRDGERCGEGETFTFYKFKTRKGYVDVRWVGESNGYYSESVDLHILKK